MIDSDRVRLLERFADAWNSHDVDTLMDCMADRCVFEASNGPDVWGKRYEGPKAVRDSYAAIFKTFPDAAWNDARHFVSGDRGCSEWRFTATRADGVKIEVFGCDIFTFNGDKIAVKNSLRKYRA